MNPELKRDIILDNYQNPHHYEHIEDESFIKINTRNSSCIDNLDFQIKLENNIIKDIYFTGEACAISTATSSIMIKLLSNKTINEALDIINNYHNMINEQPYNREVLSEALAFDEIYKQQNRKNCALLPWNGLLELLEKKNDN